MLHCFFLLQISVEPIEFKEPLRDVRVSGLGGSARFSVDVGRPRTRAHWLKDGLDIAHDGRKYDITSVDSRHQLTVNDVEERDAGDYTCLVKGHRWVKLPFFDMPYPIYDFIKNMKYVFSFVRF